MEINGFMSRVGHGEHHPWLSRDYLDIDCLAIGCMFNKENKCSVPSLCKINDNGQCIGFVTKPVNKEINGD